MLELANVTKTYNGIQAIDAVNLTIPVGKTTVLIGPSGCGKSTLLRLMIGLSYPDSGSILFNNLQITFDNLGHLRKEMGYVIQEGGLFPHLTARKNVNLMANYLNWDAKKIEDRVSELAELTQFPEDGLDRFPAQLSGGQRQRVSLMRALMLNPIVLLLDEPLGALDPIIRSELQVDLRAIFKKLGKTVVMVTHDLCEAGYFGDTIVLLREGKIVQQGILQELVDSPADSFVGRFINAQRSLIETLGDLQK